METILIVITLVLASLAFIGVIVVIILIVKSHRPVGPDKEQIQATEQIKAANRILKRDDSASGFEVGRRSNGCHQQDGERSDDLRHQNLKGRNRSR